MLKRSIGLACVMALFAIVFGSSTYQASESELSKLMRVMANDMKKMKPLIASSKHLKKWGKDYASIKTAKPSADSKKGEHFDEYANAFLTRVAKMQAVDNNVELIPQYNLLVQSCIRCHETYCPGPISMLRKLKLPE